MCIYGWRLDAGTESSQVFGAWITILRLVLFSYSKTQSCNSLVKVGTDVFCIHKYYYSLLFKDEQIIQSLKFCHN